MRGKKRETILNTAKQMFSRYGIRKTNLNEIARMARVAKATIYNYFGSKEQMYVEVLNREANELMDKILETIVHIKSPVEKLRVFCLTRFVKMNEQSNMLQLNEDDGNRDMITIDTIRKRLFHKEITVVQSILEEGVKEGIFHMDNIIQTARVIGCALRGLEKAFPADRSKEEIESDFEGLFTVLCRGILIEKGRDSRG